MESRTVGFTYVLSNPAMPGMAKVGYTTTLAEDRAKELHPTTVPLPYAVEFEAPTSFPQEVRTRAHQMLGSQRVAQDREFFWVTPGLAIEAVRDALLDVAGLEVTLAGLLGCPVDLVEECALNPRVRRNVEAEALRVF